MREILGRAPRRRRWDGFTAEARLPPESAGCWRFPEIFWVNSTRRRGVFDLMEGGSPLRTVLCPGFPGIRENYGEPFLRIELLADKKPRKSFCFPTFATAASVTRAQIGAENLKFGIREAIRPEQGKSRWSGNRLRRMMPQTHAPSGNDKRRIPYLHVGSDVPLSDLG